MLGTAFSDAVRLSRRYFSGLALLTFSTAIAGCGGGASHPTSASTLSAQAPAPAVNNPPTGPSPTVTVNGPPAISCPSPITLVTSSSSGGAAVYAPSAQGGEGFLRVACTPASGANFPIGTTPVECKATDSLDRSASCTFPVTLVRQTTLSRVRFTAFGDSITAGEITVPVTTAPGLLTKDVLVSSASYPTVLFQTLRARYPSQFSDLVVFNDGQGAERAEEALPRFVEDMNLDRPTAVLLMEGYNDVCCNHGQAGVSAGERGISEMAAEARHRGARVFIATLAPPKAGGVRANNPDIVLAYNDRMRAVATGEGAVLVDIYNALLPDVEHNIGVDGMHPTELGYHRIADTFFAAIQRELEQK